MIRAAHQMRRRPPAARQGKNRQQHQRDQHDAGRFMNVRLVLVEARLAVKRQKEEPEHVQRGKPAVKIPSQ